MVEQKVKPSQAMTIAKKLLSIGAVHLRPNEPFIWSSGIQSPIYCDNRLTLSYPSLRREIAAGLVHLIQTHYPDAEMIAGTATAGIPHAAWVAERMNLPLCYVRANAKSHGKQNQIEGDLKVGSKTVVVEDLISTGGSSLRAAQALQNAGADVLGVVAIFTYEFEQAEKAFFQAGLSYQTLSNYSSLLQVAEYENMFTEEELCKLKKWNPF